jgi:hypothetical protein
MRPSPLLATETFRTVGLVAVLDAAGLQERMDVKYLISVDVFLELAYRLRSSHALLEIDGLHEFAYRTTYFDTADLRAYRDHMQQRRRRYKCRAREYVDSGLCAFEVKLKSARGRTVKHRMPYDHARRDELSEPALAFLNDCVQRWYGRRPEPDLRPALAATYTRITLVAPQLGERLTCDYALSFHAPDGAGGRLAENTVVVESKSLRGGAIAERELLALGARPESVCSKYCLGIGITNPHVKTNDLRPLMRRHFHGGP